MKISLLCQNNLNTFAFNINRPPPRRHSLARSTFSIVVHGSHTEGRTIFFIQLISANLPKWQQKVTDQNRLHLNYFIRFI